MAAAPPPPPDPNHFNSHFSKSSCSATGSRPALRRHKTLSNPEGVATGWRRQPLLDVTNFVLGGAAVHREGRLQRVPSTPTFTNPGPSASTLLSSPSPSPRPARRLRRTQSDIPSSSSSPFTSLNAEPNLHLPSPSGSSTTGSPLGATRITRRRTITTAATPDVVPAAAAARSPTRTRTTAGDNARASPSVPARRTRSSLPIVLEEHGVGEEEGEEGDRQRRLRRRRTSTGGFR